MGGCRGVGQGVETSAFRKIPDGWDMAKQSAGAALRQLDKTVRNAVLTSIQNASDDIQSTSRDVVRAWKNKPDFKDEFTIDPKRIECILKPKGSGRVLKIFGYVDKGTKGPYLIPKVLLPGRMLKFRTGYSARTMPIAKYNVGSGTSFGGWVSKKQVVHPGIKPRKFIETFMDELIPTLQVRVQTQITRSV